MAKFFIDRPIFAWVIAIILMLAGGASIFTLPVEQYPTIAPPAIQIAATYPGASAKTVEDTVTQVIEQQMSGLDHLLYFSSTSDDSGQATITLTFAPGTNPEELIGAAHAGCFSMALSMMLGEAGLTAERIETRAEVTLDKQSDGFAITAVHLVLRARVPGADAQTFEQIANKAKAGCPVSKVLNAKISLDASLDG